MGKQAEGIRLSCIGSQGAAGASWLVDACPCLGAEQFCVRHWWRSEVRAPLTPERFRPPHSVLGHSFRV